MSSILHSVFTPVLLATVNHQVLDSGLFPTCVCYASISKLFGASDYVIFYKISSYLHFMA